MRHIFSDVLKILITKFSYQFASRNMILYIIKTVLGVAQSSLFLTLFPMCLCWCLVIRFRDHPLSTYAKFSEKLTFLNP